MPLLAFKLLLTPLFIGGVSLAGRRWGPAASGLLSPFPVYGVVLAAFSHLRQGASAATQLVRGNAVGSLAFVVFFAIAGVALVRLPLGAAYLLAGLGSLGTGAVVWRASRSRAHGESAR